MLDMTPKTHQDYLSTFSLCRSTDMVVRVLTEVKIREDEYNLLKSFTTRLQGLSLSSGLATRQRRLLHSGPLQLVLSNLCDPSEVGVQEQQLGDKRKSRSSRLLDAIGKPNSVMEKPASLKSASSSSSSTSNIGHNGLSATLAPTKTSWLSRLPLRIRSQSQIKSESPEAHAQSFEIKPMTSDISMRTVDLQAFVFNDLVLLARQAHKSGPEPSWILSEELGLFRPLSIARIRRRNLQGTVITIISRIYRLMQIIEGTIFSLEAASLDPEYFNDPCDFKASSFRIVDLLIPPSPATGGQGVEVSDDVFQPWFVALRQCCKNTLRKFTFLGSASQEYHSLGSDQSFDTQVVVTSLIESGLPIPRSPSGHLPEALDGPRSQTSVGDEREERGWWSLRYQQVFREFQRQDSVLSDYDED